MKNTDFQLGFNCPVDIHKMPKCTGGFHCTRCDKIVLDYSGMNLETFEKKVEQNQAISTCGIYKGYQLDKVYGDWRDKLNKQYRKTIRKASQHKRHFIILPFVALFVFLVGCAKRGVCGMMIDGGWESERPAKSNLDTTKTDLPTKQW